MADPSTQNLTFSLKLLGDGGDLAAELHRAEDDLQALHRAGQSVRILDNALDRVKKFEGELQGAQIKVRALETSLSEAYAADADAPLLRRLNKDLGDAQKAAARAEAALLRSRTAVDALNLESDKTGVSTANLAQRSADLARETTQARTRIDALKTSMAEARSASSRLEEAMSMRSAAQIRADILAIERGLQNLSRQAHLGGEAFAQAQAVGQQRIASLRAELASLPVDASTQGIAGLSGAFSRLDGILAGLGIGAVGHQFLAANLAADKLQKSLNAVHGDAGKTASDLAFLKETAQRLGINLESSSGAFVQLAAAAKGTSLEGQATRDIFAGIGEAMSQLGLSSAETERAFVAIAQMMSKGTVSAEELKGQLGDVLPGAMQIAARATGMTTQELTKLMESGKLLTEDFLLRFAAEARRSFGAAGGEVQGLSNTIERVKNTWSQAFKIFGDTGALKALAGMVGVVNEALLWLGTGLTVVTGGLLALVKVEATFAAAVTTRDYSRLKDSLAEIGRELLDTTDRMARLTGVSKLVGEVMGTTAQGTRQAADAAQSAGAGWNRLVSAYDQAAESAAHYLEQIRKVTQANDDQQSVLVKLAEISGKEQDILRAKEQAARVAAQGAEQVARALEGETRALQAKVIALQEEIKAGKVSAEEKLKAIEEAKKAAEAKAEEARSAMARAEASRVAAAAAQAEAKTTADNSTRLGELRDHYQKVTEQVKRLEAAKRAGIKVDDLLRDAQIDAAQAAILYRDALSDQVQKINAQTEAKRAQLSIDSALTNLAIEEWRTVYEVAKAKGDEERAGRALAAIKALEIELAEQTIAVKKLEADAARQLAQAKIEEIKAAGELTAARRAEIKALEATVKLKQIEIEVADEQLSRMQQLQRAGQGAAAGMNQLSGSMPNVAAGLRQVGDAAGEALDQVERLGAGVRQVGTAFVNADGFSSDRSGKAIAMELPTLMSIAKQLESYGVKAQAAWSIAQEFADGNGNVPALRNPGQDKYNAGNVYGSLGTAVAKAAERWLQAHAGKDEGRTATTTGTVTPANDGSGAYRINTQTQTPAPRPVAVTINLGGRTTKVNVASQTDATALTQLLKQLESAALSAS